MEALLILVLFGIVVALAFISPEKPSSDLSITADNTLKLAARRFELNGFISENCI